LPWSLLKAGFAVHRALQKPQMVPLTRIQKLKLAQAQASGSGSGGAAAASGSVTHVQPADGAGASSSSSSSSSSIASAATLAQSNAAASGLTQESLRPPTPWLTPGNIVLALLWVLFIFMLLQIPSFSSENLAKVP
jgi:hypothetical protein